MATASGHSLWLVPSGDAERDLSATIVHLADHFGTPRFAPHLTLFGEIAGPESFIVERSKQLAAQFEPFTIVLDGLGERPEYFRCLFLTARPSDPLQAANLLARRLYGRTNDPPFEPHLSLLYGDLGQIAKHDARKLLPPFGPISFVANVLEIVRTSGEPADWERIARFKLTGGH